jgi:energy-coupling factor transporter ATP-binding protein EcfA2
MPELQRLMMSDNEKNIQNESKVIGYVVGGSLKGNLRVRLTVPPDKVQEGGFVVIQSGYWQFYGLVTDMQLGATDPRFADEQSEKRLPVGLANLLHGQTLYTNLEVMPALMLNIGPDPEQKNYEQLAEAWRADLSGEPYPIPVKTVPTHHALVKLAEAVDVATIFGDPKEDGLFIVGHTLEQRHPVCLNLDKFVQRSAGIFGATGTGKSFLTRMILAGLIHHNRASVLVFDMHNEYGFDDLASDTGMRVAGLRSQFPTRARVVGLGSSATIRGQSPDFNLVLAEDDIRPQDIEMLSRELNLKETTPTTLAALERDFGKKWFREFKNLKNGAKIQNEDGKMIPAPDSVEAWANQAGIHPGAAEALHSKLSRVFNKSYIMENPPSNSLNEIVKMLAAGQHIILSFGEYESDLDYLLVTNLLTRFIRERWEQKTNDFRSEKGEEPRPLVIAVEEAHKLLNREMSMQTAFSTIAREMRKYYVTLLIIDQRPSQIYDEVMSQLGTRVSGWLGDDADIQAVLSGLAGRDALRGMLARLQPKEEVLLLGWGMPMPIPVRSRRYDDQFWQELKGASPLEPLKQRTEADILGELGF